MNVIFGASGNTGGEAARQLLAKKHSVPRRWSQSSEARRAG